MAVKAADYLQYAQSIVGSAASSELAARTTVNRAYYSAHLCLRKLESALHRPAAPRGTTSPIRVGHDELQRMIDVWDVKDHAELRLRSFRDEAKVHGRVLRALLVKRKIADYDMIPTITHYDARSALVSASNLAKFFERVWDALS